MSPRAPVTALCAAFRLRVRGSRATIATSATTACTTPTTTLRWSPRLLRRPQSCQRSRDPALIIRPFARRFQSSFPQQSAPRTWRRIALPIGIIIAVAAAAYAAAATYQYRRRAPSPEALRKEKKLQYAEALKRLPSGVPELLETTVHYTYEETYPVLAADALVRALAKMDVEDEWELWHLIEGLALECAEQLVDSGHVRGAMDLVDRVAAHLEKRSAELESRALELESESAGESTGTGAGAGVRVGSQQQAEAEKDISVSDQIAHLRHLRKKFVGTSIEVRYAMILNWFRREDHPLLSAGKDLIERAEEMMDDAVELLLKRLPVFSADSIKLDPDSCPRIDAIEALLLGASQHLQQKDRAKLGLEMCSVIFANHGLIKLRLDKPLAVAISSQHALCHFPLDDDRVHLLAASMMRSIAVSLSAAAARRTGNSDARAERKVDHPVFTTGTKSLGWIKLRDLATASGEDLRDAATAWAWFAVERAARVPDETERLWLRAQCEQTLGGILLQGNYLASARDTFSRTLELAERLQSEGLAHEARRRLDEIAARMAAADSGGGETSG